MGFKLITCVNNKTAQIIDALENSKNGLSVKDIINMGISMHRFHGIKATVNNRRGFNKSGTRSKKYSNIQIIRAGVVGNSRWKLAQISPKETLEYTRQRFLREKNSLLSSVQSTSIAIASEPDLQKRLKFQFESDTQLINRVQLLEAVK